MEGFRAFLFDGNKATDKAFDELEDYLAAYDWIDDAAVISQSTDGAIRVHSPPSSGRPRGIAREPIRRL